MFCMPAVSHPVCDRRYPDLAIKVVNIIPLAAGPTPTAF
jgi:hypothetical protein